MEATNVYYNVIVRRMLGNDNRVKDFSSYDEAYQYYLSKCNDHNCLDNAEFRCGDDKPNLMAGGTGYDYRIELEEVIED